jgi:hypothetical protein
MVTADSCKRTSEVLIRFSWSKGGHYFVQVEDSVLSVNESGARQTEIHTTETLIPLPSASKHETVIENIRIYKSSGADQIPVHRFKQEVQQYVLRTNASWNKEAYLNSERDHSHTYS